ncbi:MAG: Uma2 family endonuclease [Bacteroidota bacterium]
MGEKLLSHRFTLQEYLKMEQESEVRHEFHNGEVFAMAGGTYNHSVIGSNALAIIHGACAKNACIPFNGDMKVEIQHSNKYLYPEVSVVCGKVELSEKTSHAITNPVLIAEVLSESTEGYDRGAKFRYYQQLSSFREYLLIDQASPVVTVYYLNDQGVWEMRNYMGLDAKFTLRSLAVEISLETLYLNTQDLQSPLP